MTKRGRDSESEDDDDIDEIIKVAVREALRKRKKGEDSKPQTSFWNIFRTSGGAPQVPQQINEIAGDIIHEGEITNTELVEGGLVIQYTFHVKFPNLVPLSTLERLQKIEGIVRTEVDNVPGKEGLQKVVLTYTLDVKLGMRFRKEELMKERPLNTDPVEGAEAFKAVKKHIQANIEIDTTEDAVRKSEKPLAKDILLVSIAQAIKTPVRLEQLQRLRHHSLIRDVATIAHPKADKVRVVLDFLKEKPDA